MKWTTRAMIAQAHWFGFNASERRSAPCNGLCRTFVRNGVKYTTHFEPSRQDGKIVVDDNLPISDAERQRRRGKAK